MIPRTALLLLLVTACGQGSTDPQVISREQFIQVNVELRQIPPAEEDAEESRRTVLNRHGLTEEQVLDFVEHGGHSIEELREIWTEITRRLDDGQDGPDSATGGRSI